MRGVFLLLLMNTVVFADSVEIRAKSSAGSVFSYKGAYIGNGVVVCRKDVFRETQGKPTVYWNGRGTTAYDWAKATASDLGVLRIHPFPGIQGTPINKISFEDSHALANFVANVYRQWGIQEEPLQVSSQSSLSVHKRTYTEPIQTVVSTQSDTDEIEYNLAMARAEIIVLREQLSDLDGIESDVASVAVRSSETKSSLDTLRGRLDLLESQINSLEEAKFTVEVIFPSGEKYTGAVKAKGGLLRLDFSGNSPESLEE